MTILQRAIALAVVSACSISVGACSDDDDRGGGPLQETFGDPRDVTTVCAIPDQEGRVFFGMLYLRAPEDDEVTITDFSFETEDGLSLIEANIAPESVKLWAADRGYPPKHRNPEEWAKVRPLIGATFDSEQQIVNVGMQLDPDVRVGVASNPVYTYELDGKTYVAQASTVLKSAKNCEKVR